ncbi:hypothetical protein [Streptomyces zingiberis]|uniref:Secreted protein n=1 Tax=Streptomyces zingiberis TaxID=2053010 RepID=A0ABX1CA79_9ACTN|nr:hypothetical protein [Streptomyces zingiberis]NJQ03829.1 hypothetical protein [Streptomyces zingiberis]
MRIRPALAAAALAAALAVGAAGVPAQAADAGKGIRTTSGSALAGATASQAAARTWQPTGEYYRTKTTCTADASYYLSASNVYGYRCIQMDTNLWRGEVYAD